MASPRPVWLVCGLAAAAGLLAFEYVAAVAALGPLLEAFAHNWLFAFLPLAAAGACAARAVRDPAERLPWAALAVTMVAWSAADAYYVWGILRDPAPPYPSLTDAGWLPFYPVCLLAVVALLRREARRPSAAVALDAAVAALSAGAVLVAIVGPWLVGNVTGDAAAIAVTLAYPVFDVLLLATVMAAFAVTGWRPGLRWSIIAVGLLLRVIEDTGWLHMVTHGGYVHGTVMDVMCPGSMLLLGIAAWVAPRAQHAVVRPGGLHVLVVPALGTLTALAVLIVAHVAELPLPALLLAGAALLAVVARMGATYGELRSLAGSREEALTDYLTGLGNRRRLTRDLEAALAGGADHSFALFDLDRFKLYNDLHGHPAGDALLARLGARLSAAVGASGAAYRLGGDEFCVLVPGAGDAALAAARRALTTSADGVDIEPSFGVALLPAEAADATYALQLADERMFLVKKGSRTPWERQVRDVLIGVLAEQQPELNDHSGGVAEHVRGVGRQLGLRHAELQQLVWAAELHDIGKCAMPLALLNKPGPLSDDEWVVMRTHTLVGERMLARAPALSDAARLVRSSHERWDGGGYPDGLAGDAIPLGARVIAVCDAYDAIRSDRPYQRARTHEEALAELRRGAGAQFDPAVVAAFEAGFAPGFEVVLGAVAPRSGAGLARGRRGRDRAPFE